MTLKAFMSHELSGLQNQWSNWEFSQQTRPIIPACICITGYLLCTS